MHLHFLFGLAIDISYARSLPAIVHEDVLRQSIGAQLEILRRLSLRKKKIRRREKCAYVASGRTFPAKMARGMAFMRLCELGTTIRQVWHSHLVAAGLEDVIKAAEFERRQIIPVRITGPVLHRTGYPDHLLDTGIERIDFGIGQRPIHVVAVERCNSKIDITQPRRTAA